MKKRFPPAALLLALALLIPVFVFAQQPSPGRRGGDSASGARTPSAGSSAAAARLERANAAAAAASSVEQDFAEALTVIQENHADGSKLNYSGVFKASIIGMLRTLDPHSNFYDAKEYEEMRADWRSEYYGIGASIGDRLVAGERDTYILATFRDAPAHRAGLKFGDRIVEVDAQPVKGKASAEVRDKLRGPKGSSVKVTVERASSGARETVEIVREAVGQPSVPDAYLIRPGVGYVDMTRGFNYDTAKEFAEKLEDLRGKGMTSLVLDLRNNPGGLLDQAVKVTERFLPQGQLVVSQEGRGARGGAQRAYKSENRSPDQTPLVVLVNRNSASASEIVAGAIQDHDRGLVVGETTFGKGLVQSIMPLDYGTALTLTTSKYLTPSGRLIQRDYSQTSLYDYYTRGGVGQQSSSTANGIGPGEQPRTQAKPTGPESLTDSGRVVYGGGGISPDEAVKPRVLSPAQQRLFDPVFAFARELAYGRVAGFADYKVARPVDFEHDLQPSDFPVTPELFAAFKEFVAKHKDYKFTPAQLERERDYVMRQLRYDLATAAYGTTKAGQALIQDDPQVTRAVEALPRARELAAAATRGRNPPQKSYEE